MEAFYSKLNNEDIKDKDYEHTQKIWMIEKGIRGGVSSIIHRHGKANNKYMKLSLIGRLMSFILKIFRRVPGTNNLEKDFNPKEPSKYLQYLNAKNLYGWEMSKPLPIKGFKWMKEDELKDWQRHRGLKTPSVKVRTTCLTLSCH